MDIPREKIQDSLASFLAVAFLFSGGWYYLDQKRLDAVKKEQDALKLEIEADIKLKQYAERESLLAKKEKAVELSMIEQSHDKELSELTLKFVNEFSGIDFHRQCGDDPEHNSKAKQANALLGLIEAKASEYGRMDVAKFAKEQRFGIHGWSAKCKP